MFHNGSGDLLLRTNLQVFGTATATNGYVMPPIATYAGTTISNGLAAFWNSNGVVFLRSSTVGGTTSTDTKLSP